jgi:hypothetical protein
MEKQVKIVNKHVGGGGGAVYGLGMIGALIYYLQHAVTFGAGVVGFLKALVWPAFLVYKLLDVLKF